MIRRFHEAARDGAHPSHAGEPDDPGASSCTSTTWQMPATSCWTATTTTGRSMWEPATTSAIAELADLVAEVVGYHGEISWDTNKPDGTPRKLLDIQRLNELGWTAKISLAEGIRTTYEWFLAHQGDYRR